MTVEPRRTQSPQTWKRKAKRPFSEVNQTHPEGEVIRGPLYHSSDCFSGLSVFTVVKQLPHLG